MMRTEELIGLAIPFLFVILLVLESRASARVYLSTKHWRWIGFAFLLLLLMLGSIIPVLLPLQWMAQNALVDLSASGLWALPTGLLATTFVNYWLHRAEHHFNWLWLATHQLHHSASRIDLTGAFFTHPLEIIIKVILSNVVATYGLGMSPVASATLGVISASLSMFQHCNINTPTWLGYFVQRPESHVLHHASGIKVANFSDLPLWDLLFRTFNNPTSRWTGEVGIHNTSQTHLKDLLLMRDIFR